MSSLRLSLIIPVYNEERYLAACLDAVAAQRLPFTEVIVVDNNSNDASAAIAKSYPFVTLLQDSRQGQVYAQATGFDAASGDILARIDADTILPPAWSSQVAEAFTRQPDVLAVSGVAVPYDVMAPRIVAALFGLYHRRISSFFAGHPLIWGANAALRASAWRQVRTEVFFRRDIWEDFDMSFCIAKHGRLAYVADLRAKVSFRKGHKNFAEIYEYEYRGVRTFRLRTSWFRASMFYLLWATMALLYPVMVIDRLMNRRKGVREVYGASLDV